MKRLFAPLIIATALAVLAVLSIPTPAFAQGAAVAIIPAGSSWSGIGCAIVTNAIGIVVNGTPTNYTPTESHVAGHLTGLDVKLGEFDLQQAAENGATVVGMPITLGQVTIASPAAATNSLMLRLLGVNPSDPSTYRGGVIGWSTSANTGLSGYTYVNSDNQLVWDTTPQAAYNDAGVAWVDFDDGSASFGGGGLTISSAGVLGGSGAATWLATLTTALNMRSDSVGVQFGEADDAKIWFDGDSLNITANAVTGTDGLELNAGYVKLTGGIDVKPTADSTAAFNITTSNGTDVVVIDTTNRRVGIGGAPGAYGLTVSSGAALISGGGLDVTGGNGIYCSKRMLVNGTGGHYLTGSGVTIGSTAAVTAGMALDVVGNARVATNLTVVGLSYIILPTATNGLSAGMLWNNAGTVSVMP